MKKTTVIVIAVVAVLVGLFLAKAFPKQAEVIVGTAGTCTDGYTCFTNLEAQGDLMVSGGTVNIPTTANATSSVIVGCVQTYATSSATSLKLIFGTTATTTGNGFVLWQYGTCPNL